MVFNKEIWSWYIKEKKFKLLHTIIWTLIVFFGIFMIMNDRRLLGWLTSTPNNNQNITSTTGYERIEVGHDGLNIIPEVITLIAGKNYELVITPSDNGKWCMVSLTIPGLDRTINRIIKGQLITYKFTNIQKGTYTIVCWTMGMYQWKIIVQ